MSALIIPTVDQVPVLTMPMFDPGQGRRNHSLPEGMTIAEIVTTVLPELSAASHPRLRIALSDGKGRIAIIPQPYWHRVRPHAGTHVIIRLVPANEDLRSILLGAVAIAAVALGQFWAPSIVGALGIGTQFTGLVAAGITAGVAALGGLLVDALVPARSSNNNNGRQAEKPTYSISGWRNSAVPDGVVTSVLGRHRLAPNFVASSWTEIVGDDQYVRALFSFGFGPLLIEDIRIGETPIANFSDVEIELRQGYPDDAPCALFPQQVLEQALGVELRRDYPRDGYGDPVTSGGAGALDPIARYSARDVTELAVILGAPAGMVEFNDEGDPVALSVEIRIRARPIDGAWTDITTFTITGKQSEAFFRVYRWSVPTRGRYEVELTRMTPERTLARQSDRIVWSALQGFRPEYPLNYSDPMALLAMRIRATHQLNGTLDTVNAIATRIAPDWDQETQSWITRPTRNPASAKRYVLQGSPAIYPKPDSAVNLNQLQDFHEFCTLHNLKYDRVHDYESSQLDVLADIAAAGRATWNHDGRQWGVVIDRAGEPIIDHLNSVNAADFSWARTYFRKPDGFRVSFLDSTNDYSSAERVVPWPGGAGDIEVTQGLELPGKTDPDEIWIEARRRMHELELRPDRFSCVQGGTARRVTRGDRVLGAFDTLEHTLSVHRAVRSTGDLIELAGRVRMVEAESYACRYRIFHVDDAGFEVMQTVLRSVVTTPGETDVLQVTGNAEMPAAGEPIHFGIAGKESLALIVTGTEAGEDLTTVVWAVAEAPEIDALTAAEVPPAWDGRVGGAIDDDTTAPTRPIVRGVELLADGFTVLLEPGAGSAVVLASFAMRHRLTGAISWSGPVSGSVGSGALTVGGYDPADDVEFEVQAISLGGVGSLWTDTTEITIPVSVGAPDPFDTATATAGLGHVSLVLPTPADARIAKINIYRNATSTFGTATLVATLNGVLPASSYSHIDGDSTRSNLVVNPGFDDASAWVPDTDWAIAAGKASKTPGTATAIEQALALIAGKTYRFGVTAADRTDGALTVELTGGSAVASAPIASNGLALGALVAGSGNDTLSFVADADFDGSIDGIVLFEQSPTSLSQGAKYYFITAANAAGDESPPLTLGPITLV